MEKISGIYKITNTVTGDFYIGSSKDVKHRWANHKCKSSWNEQPNNPMYQDMQKYGVDSFDFQILEEADPEYLKEKEQQFIEALKPTYNNYRAKGLDIERYKENQKEYEKTDKCKEYRKEYQKSDKYKKYKKQLCLYNDEILTLCALATRFRRAGISHSTLEAKKYLIKD